MKNHCKDYKTTEIKKIKQLHADGYTLAYIAEIMERSHRAISAKCRESGLRRYKLKGETV